MANGTPAGLSRAYLELKEIKSSATGEVTTGASKGQIEFQFNPKDFQIERKANWRPTPTTGSSTSPPVQYTGPDPTSITLEMFLDGSESGKDVSREVDKLMDACIPTDTSKSKNRPLPPAVRFGWDKVYFEGYLEKVSAKYTLFKSDGTPIRALCTLTLKELPKENPRQNPTSGALSAQGSRRVVAGDSLAAIAYQEYGDPNLWRAIAEANGIDDPLRLVLGSSLLIPGATGAAASA